MPPSGTVLPGADAAAPAGTGLTTEQGATAPASDGRRPSSAAQLAGQGAVLVAPPKRRVFPGQPDQVAPARRFVARALDGCPVTDTAVLLASELITNTLQHTDTSDGGTFEVIVWRGLAAACVAVLDDGSDSTPTRRAPVPGQGADSATRAEPASLAEPVNNRDPAISGEPASVAESASVAEPASVAESASLTEAAGLSESGYGLALVDRLAARWGHRGFDGGAVRATVVWFLLRWNAS
jgi:anti-sigma regulatory factor (Ser/Thr protein kinase)